MSTAYQAAYQDLLVDYMPRPIRSEREYRKACREIKGLMEGGTKLPRAESEMLEVLSLLVDQYESAKYPIPDASPAEMLVFLIEQKGLTKATVARETGIPRSLLTDVLAGRRNISTANVTRLAKYFRVSAAVFIAD